MDQGRKRRRPLVLLLLLSASGALLIAGWKTFWFLTDDAFISFRYVSNSMLGHGYVWNAPPFHPVEGYTSFLWVALLDGVWRALGIAPPAAANYVSLLFAFLTLLVVAWMVTGMRLGGRSRPYRSAFLGLVLLGIVTNRTFLTWSSSGLETAMFNFFVLLWLGVCIRVRPDSRWFGPLLGTSAALIYLTRPDGVLFVLATLVILALAAGRRPLGPGAGQPGEQPGWLRGRWFAGLLPLLALPAHLVWRLATYGEWLPNSYYAKVTGPWPGSGVRYAASFVLEYGIWLWVLLLLAVGGKALWSRWGPPRDSLVTGNGDGGAYGETALHPWRSNVAIPAVTLAVHGLYYTFIVGGDHFEYRVYSHLIPLAFITFFWMLNRLDFRRSLSIALLVAFVLLSLPVGWTHWALTRNLQTREQTHNLFAPIAGHWPGPLRWYARAFDSQQAWLTAHYVCTRHQEHKINCEFLRSVFPSREEGAALPDAGYPVFAFGAVGVVSWVMPEVNIIDTHGINDYVIARSPVEPGTFRMMGHDRMAPDGYVECFRPNVEIMRGRRLVVHPRKEPLTPEEIIECESRWIQSVR